MCIGSSDVVVDVQWVSELRDMRRWEREEEMVICIIISLLYYSSIIANSLVAGLFLHARHEHKHTEEEKTKLDDIMPISLSAAPKSKLNCSTRINGWYVYKYDEEKPCIIYIIYSIYIFRWQTDTVGTCISYVCLACNERKKRNKDLSQEGLSSSAVPTLTFPHLYFVCYNRSKRRSH